MTRYQYRLALALVAAVLATTATLFGVALIERPGAWQTCPGEPRPIPATEVCR